jgi:hypothetical protein
MHPSFSTASGHAYNLEVYFLSWPLFLQQAARLSQHDNNRTFRREGKPNLLIDSRSALDAGKKLLRDIFHLSGVSYMVIYCP